MPTTEQPPAALAAPVTDAMLRKAHAQNLGNIIKQLADGKKLSKFEIKQLEAAAQSHPADRRTALEIMVDDIPGHIAKEIARKDVEEERGKSIVELRAMMKAAIEKGELDLAFKIRKELNALQGLAAKGAVGFDLFDTILTENE